MSKKLRSLEPRDLALAADLELEGTWRVEYFDSDGAGYIAIFAGQSAELRARDYYDAIERGALNTRIADAQVVTAKKVVSFPQKRRVSLNKAGWRPSGIGHTMAKSVAKIRFETRPVKGGPGWLVIITFPDRPEMQVSDFATEADAKNWITNDSWVWLKKLGYGG